MFTEKLTLYIGRDPEAGTGDKAWHQLAKEQLSWQSLHHKVGNLASREAVKDAVQAETVLLLLEAEAAIFKRMKSVGNAASIRLVNLVGT